MYSDTANSYYYPNGGDGASGNALQNDQMVAAIQTSMYSGGQHCGKMVKVSRTDKPGKSIMVKIADECPGW